MNSKKKLEKKKLSSWRSPALLFEERERDVAERSHVDGAEETSVLVSDSALHLFCLRASHLSKMTITSSLLHIHLKVYFTLWSIRDISYFSTKSIDYINLHHFILWFTLNRYVLFVVTFDLFISFEIEITKSRRHPFTQLAGRPTPSIF